MSSLTSSTATSSSSESKLMQCAARGLELAGVPGSLLLAATFALGLVRTASKDNLFTWSPSSMYLTCEYGCRTLPQLPHQLAKGGPGRTGTCALLLHLGQPCWHTAHAPSNNCVVS